MKDRDICIESSLPVVSANGLNTNKDAYFGGTLTVVGNIIGPGSYAGADIIVDANGNGNYTDIQSALDAVPSTGATIYVADGTYSLASGGGLLIKRSNTRLILSGGATVQCNGATVTTMIASNDPGNINRVEIRGGKWLQTQGTAQGTCLNASDFSDSDFYLTRIEEFGIGVKLDDTTNTTFYNRFGHTQIFNCNNCIQIGVSNASTQPNDNQFFAMRCRPKAGGAGYSLRIADARGIGFFGCDFEPSSPTGITNIKLEANIVSGGVAREIGFYSCWIEGAAVGIDIDAGCARNTFNTCSITSNTIDIDDSGTDTTFINCNKTGTTYTKGTTSLPQTTFIARHDCYAATNSGEVTFSTTGTAVAWAGVANWDSGTIGVCEIDLGTTTTGRGSIGSANTNILQVGAGQAFFSTRVQFPNLSDGTNTYSFRAGLLNSTSAEPSNGCFFRYTNGTNSGKFQCVTRSGGVETATDSGITVAAATTYTLDVIVNPIGSSVGFRINGSTVATNTTNIPTTQMGYFTSVIRSAGTSNFLALDVDYMVFKYQFITDR